MMAFRLGVGALIAALLVGGCSGDVEDRSPGAGGETYPLVTETEPERQPATTVGGAIVKLPVKPTVRELAPSQSCERVIATFHDGSVPAKRPIIVPPAPGLRALAISARVVRLEWSFRSLPDDCRPAFILLSIEAGDDPSATPTTQQFPVRATRGSAALAYPDFLPPPDVARARALTHEGRSSRTAVVLVTP